MRSHVDILTLSPKSTFAIHYFFIRIIAIEAQLYFLGWSDYSSNANHQVRAIKGERFLIESNTCTSGK